MRAKQSGFLGFAVAIGFGGIVFAISAHASSQGNDECNVVVRDPYRPVRLYGPVEAGQPINEQSIRLKQREEKVVDSAPGELPIRYSFYFFHRLEESSCKVWYDANVRYVPLNPAPHTSYLDKAEWMLVSELPKITRWLPRYAVSLSYVGGIDREQAGPIERIDAAVQADAYQESSVRSAVWFFTPDGKVRKLGSNTVRQLYRYHRTVLVGEVQPRASMSVSPPAIGADFSSELHPECRQNSGGEWICGFLADMEKKYSISHLGKIFDDEEWDYGTKAPNRTMTAELYIDPRRKRIGPDSRDGRLLSYRFEESSNRWTLFQRFGPLGLVEVVTREKDRATGQEKLVTRFERGGHSSFFYSNFGDPIRPVVFAPGVLLRDGTKYNARGRYPKKDLVQREVCIADCPEHLRLQGLDEQGRPLVEQ